jgi:lipopolysaccharide biosynthesis glycosyltransferase
MVNSIGSNPSQREIVLVSGADEHYALPLAVTISSALKHLDSQHTVRLYILDGGISEASKDRLVRSWNDPRLSIHWLHPDINSVRDLPVSDHISLAAYLRLLLPDLLPDDVKRVIYLDADMLVRTDLTALWGEPQDGCSILAVQDLAAPYIDSSRSLPNFQVCNPYLSAAYPVANYRELGICDRGMYFNSGLLVIDIQDWRSRNVSGQLFDCLREHRQHVLWWDQYALNAVLAGRWRCLDHRWNQGAHIYHYPNWQSSPFSRELFQSLKSDPWIVHFCSPSKPWHYLCNHPYAREFRQALKQTEWRDYQPTRPEKYVKLWWEFQYKQVKKQIRSRLGSTGQRRAA